MNYGKLELNIDRILKERGISKNRFAKIWIFPDQISIDTATTIFAVWIQVYYVNYVIT